jgi:hypothetical protein
MFTYHWTSGNHNRSSIKIVFEKYKSGEVLTFEIWYCTVHKNAAPAHFIIKICMKRTGSSRGKVHTVSGNKEIRKNNKLKIINTSKLFFCLQFFSVC